MVDRDRVIETWERVNRGRCPGQWPPVTRLSSVPHVPPGYTAWAVGHWPERRAGTERPAPNTSVHVVVMPTLDPDAPPDVLHRLMARAVAIGSGRCPLCGAAAGTDGRSIDMRHEPGCGTEFTEDDKRHFPVYRRADP